MTAATGAPLLTLPEVARAVTGDLVAREVPSRPDAREAFLRQAVDGVSIDTRTLTPGQLFVPLRGGNTDGHRFLAEAFRRGAALAFCERERYPSGRGTSPDRWCWWRMPPPRCSGWHAGSATAGTGG